MANKKLLRVFPDEQVTVLDLGEMEIWDGADMALLRDSLTRLINVEKRRSIGIDMRYVKYIPSGFFGMLFDWYETGVKIRLYAPQPNVRRMLWFSRFFKPVGDDCHELKPRPDSEFPCGYSLDAEPAEEPARRNGRLAEHSSSHTSGQNNGHPRTHRNGHPGAVRVDRYGTPEPLVAGALFS